MNSQRRQKWILLALFAGIAVQLWMAYGLPYFRAWAYQHDLAGEKGWWDKQAEADMRYQDVPEGELQAARDQQDRDNRVLSGAALTQTSVFQALQSEQYGLLEARFNELQAAYESGELSDVGLLRVYEELKLGDEALAPRLDAWVAGHPASYHARLLRGLHYRALAVAARGNAFAAKTPPSSFETMEAHFAEADREYRASLSLTRKPLITQAAIIEMAMMTGDRVRADAALAAANRFDAGNLVARQHYLFLLQGRWLGSNEEMLRFLERCEQEGVPAGQLAIMRAMQLADLGRTQLQSDRFGAEQHYEQAIRLASRTPWLLGRSEYKQMLVNASAAASGVGNHTQALVHAEEALRISPGDDCGHCMAAQALMGLKRDAEAVPHLEVCSARGDAWCQFNLGLLLYDGYEGGAPDRTRGLKLIRQAAAGQFSAAQGFLRRLEQREPDGSKQVPGQQ